MNVLFEGPDNCGKGTQIELLRNRLAKLDQPVHIIHYSGFKLPKEECIAYSKKLYAEMFRLMAVNSSSDPKVVSNLIFDRAHLGEYVYGKIYRDYDADWIFNLEQTYLKFIFPEPRLIVFVDSPEKLIARDDGLSFSTEMDKKTYEVQRFIEAYEKSNLKKCLINIGNKDIATVEKEVIHFLGI